LNGLEQILWELITQLGFVGIFLVSFIGAASIVFPIPYTVIIFWLSLTTNLNPTMLIISAGIGSALGEIVGYLAGYAAKGVVGDKARKKLDVMLKVLMKHKNIWPFLVFIFAFTPLPDDLVFIPLGLVRFNFWSVFIPCIAGKLMMFYVLVFGGKYASILIHEYIGESQVFSTIFTIVTFGILLVIFWVMWKIDWEKYLTKHQ